MKEFNAKVFHEEGKPDKIIYECDKARNTECSGYGNCRGCNHTDNIKYARDVSKSKMIIEEYRINGEKYQISYLENTKAIDVFSALNRMIVSGKPYDCYKEIVINKLFEPIIMVQQTKKNKWFK